MAELHSEQEDEYHRFKEENQSLSQFAKENFPDFEFIRNRISNIDEYLKMPEIERDDLRKKAQYLISNELKSMDLKRKRFAFAKIVLSKEKRIK